MRGHMSALIIAQPGQLRDGLQVLLAAIPPIKKVIQVEDVPSALALRRQDPALVLLNGDLPGDELVAALAQIKDEWAQAQCIVLVDDEQRYETAETGGADVVLMKGILASKFFATIEELLSSQES